ncbi:MAG: plasmid recombination protein [Lachnospiraceae bacterium]|nr:plasmid recombination protein [Lachnospiraceae bacterium]
MASCKFEGGKYKMPTEVKAHFRHNDISPEMRVIAKKKNKHIDLDKCKYNFSILGLSYEERCKKYDERIAYLDYHGNTNKRKDRVTAQCIEIPVPADLPRDRYREWFLRIAEMLRAKYGEENFIDADIHYDEEHEYRDAETKELVVSRVHGHFIFVPEISGKLNCKQMTLRKNMKALNREIDIMTKDEFGCSFMSGKKTKSLKKVEELKQESENAELLCQIGQAQEELNARQAAVEIREAFANITDEEQQEKEKELLKTEHTLSEWQAELQQRETAVLDLEEQKKAVLQDQEAVRQKESQLDEAIRAVSEMPTMDECVERVLDVAVVTLKVSPGSDPVKFVARRYLEYLQESQKERAEQMCKDVKRTVPEYTFDTQQDEAVF